LHVLHLLFAVVRILDEESLVLSLCWDELSPFGYHSRILA